MPATLTFGDRHGHELTDDNDAVDDDHDRDYIYHPDSDDSSVGSTSSASSYTSSQSTDSSSDSSDEPDENGLPPPDTVARAGVMDLRNAGVSMDIGNAGVEAQDRQIAGVDVGQAPANIDDDRTHSECDPGDHASVSEVSGDIADLEGNNSRDEHIEREAEGHNDIPNQYEGPETTATSGLETEMDAQYGRAHITRHSDRVSQGTTPIVL